MSTTLYPSDCTGLLLIDPYNDFLSEGGKLNGLAKPVADAVGLLEHLREVVAAARADGIRVFYVPHQRAEPADFDGWEHPSPYQLGGHTVPSARRRQLGRRVAPGLRAPSRVT